MEDDKPWKRAFVKSDPFAPHNGFWRNSPFKPWNRPFGTAKDLTKEERRYYEERGVLREKVCYEDDE